MYDSLPVPHDDKTLAESWTRFITAYTQYKADLALPLSVLMGHDVE
jgi:hypothetical protein